MAKSEEIIMYCGLGDTDKLAAKIIEAVNSRRMPDAYTELQLTHSDFHKFPDGEPDNELEDYEKIEGRHAVLFLSVHRQELVLQLFQMIWVIKHRYKAKSLTLVMPFMAYRRQDHPEIPNEWNLNAWFIKGIKDNGADCVIVCDIHSERTIENCKEVGLEVHHVRPTPLYAGALSQTMKKAAELGKKLKVVSPDKGSLRRCISLAQKIGAFSVVVSLKKREDTGNIITNVKPDEEEKIMLADLMNEHGVKIEVSNKTAIKDAMIILREDELDTGNTAAKTARNLMAADAYQVELVVTHMKCSAGWKRRVIREGPFKRVYGGDTIHRSYEDRTGGEVVDISTDAIIADKLTEILNVL